MKKKIMVLVSIAAFVIACSPKVSTVNTASTEMGSAIISSEKCTRCHHDEKNHISRHTFADQEKLFINMAAKAKLNWQETQDMMAYVKANAKK